MLAIKIAFLVYVAVTGALWCLSFFVAGERHVSEGRVLLGAATWPIWPFAYARLLYRCWSRGGVGP